MPRSAIGELLSRSSLLWSGQEFSNALTTLPTGHPALDDALPGGGWPIGALTEIIVPSWGIGELRLLIPSMAAMTGEGRWIAWIAPPFIPYAPALAQARVNPEFSLLIDVGRRDQDLLWSMEKLLLNASTGMVLAWPRKIAQADLRRLQLSAEMTGTLGFLYCREGIQGSCAALRIKLHPARKGVRVAILKARGGWQRQTVEVGL